MSEELDLSGAVETLKGMLESDEGQKKIEDILSQFGGGESKESGIDTQDMETIMKIKKIMTAANNSDNTRQTEFLRSLAPMLKPARRKRVDEAIRLMNMTKIIEVMKEMR